MQRQESKEAETTVWGPHSPVSLQCLRLGHKSLSGPAHTPHTTQSLGPRPLTVLPRESCCPCLTGESAEAQGGDSFPKATGWTQGPRKSCRWKQKRLWEIWEGMLSWDASGQETRQGSQLPFSWAGGRPCQRPCTAHSTTAGAGGALVTFHAQGRCHPREWWHSCWLDVPVFSPNAEPLNPLTTLKP